MSLFKRLSGILASKVPKTVECIVKTVKPVDGIENGRYDGQFRRETVTETIGMSKDGAPIQQSYSKGMYLLTLVGPQGQTAVNFGGYGRPPKVGETVTVSEKCFLEQVVEEEDY